MYQAISTSYKREYTFIAVQNNLGALCVNVILEDVSDKCKSQDKLVMCRDRFYRINGNNGNHLSSKNWVMVAINCENDTYVTMGDKYASAYSNFLWQEKMVHASYNFCF